MPTIGSVNALDAVHKATATVRITSPWRLKLGCLLLRLATRVLRCHLDVTMIAREPGSACPRCGECIGCEHHWMEELTYAAGDEAAEWLAQEPIGDRVCKHCPVVGMTCDECDGHGEVERVNEHDVDFMIDCPVCDGAGIVVVPGVQSTNEDEDA